MKGDVHEPLRIWKQKNPGILTSANAWEATSSYMIGRVAVSLILMESNGNQENWTVEQEDLAISEIIGGLDRWADFSYDHLAPLTWFYDIHMRVPTSYEPISERSVPYYDYIPPHWEFLWMNDALGYLGYGNGWEGMYDYIHDLCGSHMTDWAFMTFVVMDENDPDHRFADGSPAYARLEGPYAVLTYNNAGWGIENMNRVCQHEVGHVFGAGDEYSGQCTESDCTKEYGFLHVINANCEVCNSNPDPCIMDAHLSLAACYWTVGHIGWHDYDGDLWNEAPDRNTTWSRNVPEVYPGDIITIYNSGGQLTKWLPLTPENSHQGWYTWDCTKYDGERVAFGQYFFQVNGENRFNGTPYPDENSPALSNLHSDGQSDRSFQRLIFLYFDGR